MSVVKPYDFTYFWTVVIIKLIEVELILGSTIKYLLNYINLCDRLSGCLKNCDETDL